MPAVSAKQEKFMQAVANNPKFAKKVGVPTSVGREFTKGKDMKKMEAGGVAKKMPTAKQMGSLGMKSGGIKKMAGGLAAGHKTADGVAKKGKTKGKAVKMSMGGKC